MMRKGMGWLLAAVLLLVLTGCGREEVKQLKMGTGNVAGIYFSYGGVLGQQIHDSLGFSVTVEQTEGSRANILGISGDRYQLAIAQSDVLSYAWQGRRDFDGARVDSLRAIASLYTEPIQLVTVNPEIHYPDELRGMRVSVGAPDSGIFFNAMDVLDSVSLSLEDIEPQYLSLEDTMQALREGTIDAAFLITGLPSPALQDLSRDTEFSLVPIDGPVAERILTSCSFYTTETIPAGTYPGQNHKVDTLGVRAVLVASANQDQKTIYEITRTIYENLDAIRSCNPMGKNLTPETVALGVTIPFHMGAEQYYKEEDISLR